MVAILSCDRVLADRIERQEVFGEAVEYTEAWRRDAWKGSDAHLALLIDEEDVVGWLGRVQGGKQVTSRDRVVKVTEIEQISPVPLDRIRQRMPRRHQRSVGRRGTLSPAAAAAVVDALLQAAPAYADLIQRLGRPIEGVFPRGLRGELLNQERDAVGVLLDIGGIGRAALRSWSAPPVDAPFLAGVREYSALEDSLIEHDIRRFAAWVEVPERRVSWRAFQSRSRRMFIMNANRTPVEQTLGVDVVYYNEFQKAFVLVQYKKMRREGSDEDEALLAYRPDGQLRSELQRMERIDTSCADDKGEFRLHATPCWLKLCDPDPRIEDPSALIKGMYLAREHFVELLTTCKGPRGGTLLSYSNVPRHVNNTMFTALVRDGWIGSRGESSEEIGRLIRESLETGHAVAIGVQST